MLELLNFYLCSKNCAGTKTTIHHFEVSTGTKRCTMSRKTYDEAGCGARGLVAYQEEGQYYISLRTQQKKIQQLI